MLSAPTVASASTPTGPAGDPSEPTTIAELEQAFDVADLHAEFVVVIDVSGSMSSGDNPPFPAVQEAFAALVNAIPDGDRLTLITFDSLAGPVFDGPLDAANRSVALGKLPLVATGVKTDIGAALRSAIDRLDRPNVEPLQTVIFITDGVHEAPQGSPYFDVGNNEWLTLKSRAADLETRRSIEVRALGLGGAGRQGAELVAQVFSSPEVADLDPSQLSPYLTNEVAKSRRQLLRTAVQAEVDQGTVKATVSSIGELDSQMTMKVNLTSTLPHLGVDFDLRDVTASMPSGAAVRSEVRGGSRTVHIPADGMVTVEVTLKPEISTTPLFEMPPPKHEELDIQFEVVGNAAVTPTALLVELGVSTSVPTVQPDEFTVERFTGKTYGELIRQILYLLLLLLFLVWFWWKFLRVPPLPGALILEGRDPIKLKGKRMKVSAQSLGKGIGSAELKLYTRRRHPSDVYVDVLKDPFERAVGRKWQPFTKGSSLGAVQYRLNQDMGPTFRWSPSKKKNS